MSREFAKEKSPKKEQQKELSSNQDQTDALNEYEFFLPESNGPGECLHEEDSTGEKKAEENQKSDLVDFFLSK